MNKSLKMRFLKIVSSIVVVLILLGLVLNNRLNASFHNPGKSDSFQVREKSRYVSTTVEINIEKEAEFSPLSPVVVSGVKLFVLFIGYFRSGHSIVGSLLDAHPNVVIAHEFNTFRWLSQVQQQNLGQIPREKIKEQLFNKLYGNTFNNTFKNGKRSENDKGYNLTIHNSWQGRYNKRIDVIGDKNGGGMSKLYKDDSDTFNFAYKTLQQVSSTPVYFIHCVRNPFDIISTMMLYRVQRLSKQKDLVPSLRDSGQTEQLYKDDNEFPKAVDMFFSFADSVAKISQSMIVGNSRLLEIHNHELVSNPTETVLKLCHFLSIDCTNDYIQSCADKVFPKLSKSRFNVDWSEDMKKTVQHRLEHYPFFKQYSYDSPI